MVRGKYLLSQQCPMLRCRWVISAFPPFISGTKVDFQCFGINIPGSQEENTKEVLLSCRDGAGKYRKSAIVGDTEVICLFGASFITNQGQRLQQWLNYKNNACFRVQITQWRLLVCACTSNFQIAESSHKQRQRLEQCLLQPLTLWHATMLQSEYWRRGDRGNASSYLWHTDDIISA